MTASDHVLILTSNTGGGHRSAALALEHSFLSLDPGQILVKATQVLEESSIFTRKMADFYNFLLRDHQQLMKYYYWTINRLKPNESQFLFSAALGYGRQLFNKVCPLALVSVHPMTQHFFAYLLKKLGLLGRIPFVTVVTDPCSGFWRGWACDDVDHYYVASDEAKQQLIDYGVGSHKITVSGMPVHSRFFPVSSDEKQILRSMLGLDPHKFTLFLNSGWIGGGNIPRIFESLAEGYPGDNIQVIFLGGRNEQLMQTAHDIAQCARFPVKIVGYSSDIQNLMNASDVMVTKLGGLTTFEALACHLPIIGDAVTPPMPQEAQTAQFIKKSGSGMLLTRPDDILSVVRSLTVDPSHLELMRHCARIHAKTGASDRIAQEVLTMLRKEQAQKQAARQLTAEALGV